MESLRINKIFILPFQMNDSRIVALLQCLNRGESSSGDEQRGEIDFHVINLHRTIEVSVSKNLSPCPVRIFGLYGKYDSEYPEICYYQTLKYGLMLSMIN